MTNVRRYARRWPAVAAALFVFVIAGVIEAANVLTDGTMETSPTTNWTHVDVVTGSTASVTKDTAQKSSGTSSLKILSTAGRNKTYEWYDWQSIPTVAASNTVTLSLWYGTQAITTAPATATTLTVDVSPNGTNWTTIWTKTVTPSTTFASGTQAAIDVTSSFASGQMNRIRLHATVNTGNNAAAQVAVWWDDIVLDVTAPAPITTTIGDGSDPTGVARICPGDGAQMADAFTLTSSPRNSTVTAVGVTLASGTSGALSLVEITNDAGTASYGSVANPSSDTFTIPLTSNITSTASPAQYKIRVTPKSGPSMPARPGSFFNVTAKVASITSDSATVNNADAAGTTIGIDNQSPSSVTITSATAGDGFADVAWTNPAISDLAEVIVIRNTVTPIGDAPAEGSSYSLPGTIGSSTIVAKGLITSLHDTTVVNGTSYYYKVFAKDSCSNYDAGVQTGAVQPQATPHLTSVGDGNDPTPVALCPGDGATMLDAFTFTTAVGTDTVSSVRVALSSGAAAALSLVEITNDSGSVVYGSVPNPPSDTVDVPLSQNIGATTSTTQYKVRVTPRPHSTMPAPAAAPYSITGIVTAITSADPKDYRDADSATVTIDNVSPSAPAWGTNTAGDASITLNWTNPSADFSSVVIARGTTALTGSATEGQAYTLGDPLNGGVVRYIGSGSTFTDTTAANGTTYYYRIFANDACSNYSTGVTTAALTPTSYQPVTTIGTGSATVDSCTQVTVRVPFTGDSPTNGSVMVERSTASSGPWTTACAALTSASPRTCVMTGLTAATTYYFRVTASDADGVTGRNPQLVGPVTTPAVCLASPTIAGTASARVNSCKQITATAPLTNDGNGNGSVKFEYNTTNSWPGTTACAAVSGGSPRTCTIAPLNGSTGYYVRVTYSDSDGVTGTATQILGPLSTGACAADATPPLVLFLSPARDAILGGNERFKVQVYDAGGLAAANPVQFAIDGGAPSMNVTVNTNYNCGAGCAVYEFTIATDTLANGPHFVTVQATDATGNIAAPSHAFSANNRFSLPFGSGTLLRRTHSAQLCMDCHALQNHSSQAAANDKYGTFAVDCLTCHTPHGTQNIALIRPVIRTPNSGPMTVDFRALDKTANTNPQYGQLGAYDLTGAPFNDGICEVCHTKTDHYRNDASGGDHTHNQVSRCTMCHSHTSGFKGAGCNACHNSPPAVGKHRSKHDEVWNSTDGSTATSYTDTTSHATATAYGFACAKCHSGTHKNDAAHNGSAASPWQTEVVFEGANAGGTYSGTYNQFTDKPLADTFSWSNGTCGSTYCHSNASPRGGTNQFVSVTWNGGATTCASCHKTGAFGDGTNDATYLSKSHAIHVQSSSGETNTYTYRCDGCHADVINASSHNPWLLDSTDLKDKRLHVNESKSDVAFNPVGSIAQTGGSYDGSTQTCGGTYCHSPGTKTSNFDPPNISLKWGQTGTCRSCHSGNATASPTMATGKHAQHVNISATMGTNVGCVSCHAGTVTDDNTISTAGYALHVNGSRDVSGTYTGTWGGSSTPTCTNSRCHSSGVRAGTLEYYTMNWSTGPAITDCKGCHGRHSDNAFTSVAGEPNYTNAAASTKYNSHHAHVASASDCHNCHASTVGTANKIDGTNPAKHMDFDGTPDITFPAAIGGTYNASNRTCTGVSCHGANQPSWGGAPLVCGDCHVATADSDNWTINDNVMSKISSTEWTTHGHGQSSIALPGTNPCVYCHSSSVTHYDASNPFRLANYNATGDGVNSVCLVCHKSNSPGYNPGAGLKNGTKKIDAYHFGTLHSSSANGGQRCWDCHDPHGDTNGTAGNVKMIGKTQMISATDTWGIAGTRTTITTSFTAMTTGSDFAKTAAPYNGICNVCHTTTAHYTSSYGDTTHYQTQLCTDCHGHNQPPNNAFRPGGGDCLNCHGAKTQGSTPVRRAVTADFSLNSHHVGTGGTMGGTLTNFDCVVCHAEGTVTNGKTDSTSLHMNGTIELRNADNNSAYFVYDKDAITGVASTWNSSNSVWRTQTSTALDPFCLTCHDSNGASTSYTLGDTGATAQNPFKDTAITNNYDQMTRGNIVDIKSKVSGAPPAQGTFARHAIRGQSTSIYTKYQALGGTYKSMYEFGSFNAMGTDENGKPNWNDTSVMGCADCHTSDGANGSAGNAHGANSEYMLKDANGGATKGTGITSTGTIICYRCHAGAKYAVSVHTPNNGDFQDTVGQLGAARKTAASKGFGTMFGIACMNCHGGAPGVNDGTNGYGWIHGTNQLFGTGSGGTGTRRNAYRFTNGGGVRYYTPGSTNWDTTAGSCYTLGTADAWSGCTQHSGNAGSYTKSFARPLNY